MAKKFCYDQLQQVAGLGSPNCTKLGDARCIIYTGANLTCTGILTNDTLDVIIKKLSDFACDCCTGNGGGGGGNGGGNVCIQAGDNVTITGLGTDGNCFTITVSNESIQDVVGLMFLDTPTVDFTYNDGSGQVSADVIVNGVNDAIDDIVVWSGTQFFLRGIDSISRAVINNFNSANYYTSSSDCIDIPTIHPTQITMHVGTGLSYVAGDLVTIFADATHYFTAEVVSYDSTTGILVINSISNVGTGNFCNWTVNLSALFGLSTVVTEDTVTLNLTGDGTLANPLFGDVNVSSFANNEIVILPDGLWAPGARNGLIYGGIVTWTGVGYIYNISPAGYYINGVFYTSPGITVTLAPADATFDRIDTFIVDNTSTASVLTGTPSDNPQEPPLDPATQLRLSIAFVQAGSTTPVGAVIDCLYKEDVEWTAAVNTARINVTSSSNPFEGTLDIEGTNTITGDQLKLTRPGGVFTPIPTYTTISFLLRVKSNWNNINRKLVLQWYLGNVAKGIPVNVADGLYGLITSNTSTYQIVTIPLSDFGLNNLTSVDNFRITVQTNSAIGWYIDNICISNAAASPVGLPLILNNGLNLNYATNTGQLGGTLLHNTTNDTASFIHTFRGEPVYDFPYQFFQNQYFPTGTGIVSFKNHGDYSSIDGTPHPISAKLGINYTGNVYLYSPSFPTVSIPGYFNDRIGYWEGVNATGDGSFGFKVDDSNSKVTGIFFHTEDNTYTDGVSIYAVPSGLDSGSPNFVLNRAELYNHRTVVFHTDRSNEFLGKTYMNQVRMEEAKGVNVASGSDLTLGNDGNLFYLTGNNTVNAITVLNWQAGSKIEFIFTGTATLKHNTVGGVGTAPLKLAGSVDFTASVDDAILLAYDGSFWHEIGRKLASSGGATVSADNGTHISSLNNVRLGGTLLEDTIIDTTASFGLTVTGAGTGSVKPLSVINTGGGIALNVLSNATANGAIEVNNSSTGNAITAASVSGLGGQFNSTNNVGAQISSDGGVYSSSHRVFSSGSNNSVIGNIQVVATNGLAPSVNGFGTSIDYWLMTTNFGTIRQSNQLISEWTTANDATRASKFIITGVNAGGTVDKLYIGPAATQINATRFEEYRGADVNSANDLTVGVDGNTFAILGTTQINAITRADWQAGSRIHLIFASALTVKNNTTGGAGTDPILLAGGADFTTSTNDVLTLVYSGTFWHETARKLASTGGAGVTADNGLIISSLNNVQLGATTTSTAPLLHDTYINKTANTANGASAFGLYMYTTGAIGIAAQVTGGGSGDAVTGVAFSGNGVRGVAIGGVGVQGNSSAGTAIFGITSTGLAGKFLNGNPDTTSVLETVNLQRDPGVGTSNGVGQSLGFYCLAATSGLTQLSNQIISKWTDATLLTRTSQMDITGANSAVTNTIASFYGPGVVGIGISSSYTATRLNVVDNSLAGANLVDLTSSSTAAASNSQIMLHISLSGANATNSQTTYGIDAHNDHSGTGNINIGIKGSVTNEANNQSIGVFGLASVGNGVQGQSTTGNGGQFTSSSGVGAQITSTSNYAIFASSGSSKGIGMNTSGDITGEFIRTVGSDAVAEVMRIQTNRSGGGGGVGLGPQLNFDAHNSANAVKVAGAISCTWTTATASSEVSKMVLSNTNAGTTAAAITISGAGAIQFNTYGAGTLTTDASGNITATSDERLKDIQGMYTGGTEALMNVIPIEYKWNEEAGFDREHTYIGFSAQNIQKALGDKAVGHGTNGYLTLQDRAIMATLVNTVKEQQKEIEELKALVKGLLNA